MDKRFDCFQVVKRQSTSTASTDEESGGRDVSPPPAPPPGSPGRPHLETQNSTGTAYHTASVMRA